MSRYVIRERGTNSFCTSTGYKSFSLDLEEAAIFVNKANAQKAIKTMFGKLDVSDTKKTWSLGQDCFYSGDKAELISVGQDLGWDTTVMSFYNNLPERKVDLEVCEVKLTLV